MTKASGKRGFSASGRMSVGRFEDEFADEFGVRCDIKVDGELAPDDATIASSSI